ncbi:MAG TPA: CAP domain-containing protein [Actinomycetota bacterium]|nr:CAP domain-containing protein [Actinomycetota bacterium]
MTALAKPLRVPLAIVAVIGALAVALGPQAARSGMRYHFRSTEKCLMAKINEKRAGRGLRKLEWDRQLGFVARGHAEKMARRNKGFWHDRRLGNKVTGWRRLSQNTGFASGCRSMFRAFWRSKLHRINLLGSWRFFGVGVARNGGKLYAQEIFESRTNPGNVFSFP